MKKNWILLLCAVVLLSGLISPARAEQTPDPSRLCSVTFVMEWDGTALKGGELTLYRVARLAETAVFYEFALVDELADSGVSLEDLNDPALTGMLAELVAQRQIPGRTAEIADGKAVFAELEPGIYLVTQSPEQAGEGFAPIGAFLLSLPQWDGTGYVYELTAAPKNLPQPSEPTEPTEPSEPTEPTEPGLPDTGQQNWPIPVMACSGAALMMLGIGLCFGKRERR